MADKTFLVREDGGPFPSGATEIEIQPFDEGGMLFPQPLQVGTRMRITETRNGMTVVIELQVTRITEELTTPSSQPTSSTPHE